MLAKAPYYRPVATRHFLSDSKVTSTRLSEMRASCLASWQSPSSSIQCFHWERLYSGMSAGIGATVTAREVVGVGVVVVSSWVDTVVDVSVEDAGVGVTVAVVDPKVPWGIGVGVILAGDGAMALGSTVRRADTGVPSGGGV